MEVFMKAKFDIIIYIVKNLNKVGTKHFNLSTDIQKVYNCTIDEEIPEGYPGEGFTFHPLNKVTGQPLILDGLQIKHCRMYQNQEGWFCYISFEDLFFETMDQLIVEEFRQSGWLVK